ncbi:MAG: hypothetical protein IJ127_20645, partial [Afipia sp.]|nr:hypothetical protein [Afipia sp.]
APYSTCDCYTIKSANDPPRSLEELQDRVNLEDRSGYHRHHIVEEKAARTAGFFRGFGSGARKSRSGAVLEAS